jgi:hypothetical protein
MIDTAAAVVLAVGDASPVELSRWADDRYDQGREVAETALSAGVLVPVRLGRVDPLGMLKRLEPVDLRAWRGGGHPQFDRLVHVLRTLIARPKQGLSRSGSNLGLERSVDHPRQTVSQLQDLTGRVGQLGDVLLEDSQHTADLVFALDEISLTYEAVNDALVQFMSAVGVASGDSIDRAAYHRLARQNLMEQIHNGRGSCTRIERVYARVGGLRDALQERGDAELLQQADDVFGQFGSADGDLFAWLEQFGETMTNEARAIEGLLIMGQDEVARQRITDGARRLRPMEDSVTRAREELRKIQDRLGYTNTAKPRQVVSLTFKSINIGGGTFNGPVVIADTIERTIFAASAAPSKELEGVLTDLARAVATLTTALPQDEGELAAQDLEDLTRLATSDQHKPARWRRAVDGLLGAAQRAADVGAPVIDLVAKIVQLTSPPNA